VFAPCRVRERNGAVLAYCTSRNSEHGTRKKQELALASARGPQRTYSHHGAEGTRVQARPRGDTRHSATHAHSADPTHVPSTHRCFAPSTTINLLPSTSKRSAPRSAESGQLPSPRLVCTLTLPVGIIPARMVQVSSRHHPHMLSASAPGIIPTCSRHLLPASSPHALGICSRYHPRMLQVFQRGVIPARMVAGHPQPHPHTILDTGTGSHGGGPPSQQSRSCIMPFGRCALGSRSESTAPSCSESPTRGGCRVQRIVGGATHAAVGSCALMRVVFARSGIASRTCEARYVICRGVALALVARGHLRHVACRAAVR